MPRLVLINGAPSSGKSTLATRYVEEHPLTLALDIDVVRAMLGRWLDQPVEAGLLARRMALEMARVQLLADRDVVIPQFLGRLDFLLALEQLCNDVRAEFIEVVLLAEPHDLAHRIARRSAQPRPPNIVTPLHCSSAAVGSQRYPRCTTDSPRLSQAGHRHAPWSPSTGKSSRHTGICWPSSTPARHSALRRLAMDELAETMTIRSRLGGRGGEVGYGGRNRCRRPLRRSGPTHCFGRCAMARFSSAMRAVRLISSSYRSARRSDRAGRGGQPHLRRPRTDRH